MDKSFWSKAITTAAYLSNRSPKDILDKKTPFEIWYNKKPDVSHLKIFGCLAYAKNDQPTLGKFNDQAYNCKMIGYTLHQNTYWLYNEKTKKCFQSRDVVFYETNPRKNTNFNHLYSSDSDTDITQTHTDQNITQHQSINSHPQNKSINETQVKLNSDTEQSSSQND